MIHVCVDCGHVHGGRALLTLKHGVIFIIYVPLYLGHNPVTKGDQNQLCCLDLSGFHCRIQLVCVRCGGWRRG